MPWDTMFGKVSILYNVFAWLIDFSLYCFSANVGGAFGLCLGASFISFFEIVYFVAIRVFGRILAHKYSRKTHPSEQKVKSIQTIHGSYSEDNHFGGFIKWMFGVIFRNWINRMISKVSSEFISCCAYMTYTEFFLSKKKVFWAENRLLFAE